MTIAPAAYSAGAIIPRLPGRLEVRLHHLEVVNCHYTCRRIKPPIVRSGRSRRIGGRPIVTACRSTHDPRASAKWTCIVYLASSGLQSLVTEKPGCEIATWLRIPHLVLRTDLLADRKGPHDVERETPRRLARLSHDHGHSECGGVGGLDHLEGFGKNPNELANGPLVKVEWPRFPAPVLQRGNRA
jgi:hypothetical protein